MPKHIYRINGLTVTGRAGYKPDLCITLTILAFLCVSTLIPNLAHAQLIKSPSPLELTVGAGRDIFEQDYYLLAGDTTDVPSDSLERLKLTQAELAETFLSAGVRLRTESGDLENTLYATSDGWRNLAHTYWKIGGTRSSHLRISGRLELNDKSDDSLSPGYLYTTATVEPRLRISDDSRWFLYGRGDFETTNYERRDDFVFDFRRWRTRAGIMYDGHSFQSLRAEIGGGRRVVPDSTALQYDEVFGEITLNELPLGQTRLGIEVQWQSKNYDAADDEDDVNRTSLTARWHIPLLESWRMRARAEVTRWDYKRADVVNRDANEIDATLAIVRSFSLSVEGITELRGRSVSSEETEFGSDDYDEWSIRAGFDVFVGGNLWLQFAERLGRRSYTDEESFISDYRLSETELIFDWRLMNVYSLSALVSYDIERHDDDSEDTNFLYASISLKARVL